MLVENVEYTFKYDCIFRLVLTRFCNGDRHGDQQEGEDGPTHPVCLLASLAMSSSQLSPPPQVPHPRPLYWNLHFSFYFTRVGRHCNKSFSLFTFNHDQGLSSNKRLVWYRFHGYFLHLIYEKAF